MSIAGYPDFCIRVSLSVDSGHTLVYVNIYEIKLPVNPEVLRNFYDDVIGRKNKVRLNIEYIQPIIHSELENSYLSTFFKDRNLNLFELNDIAIEMKLLPFTKLILLELLWYKYYSRGLEPIDSAVFSILRKHNAASIHELIKQLDNYVELPNMRFTSVADYGRCWCNENVVSNEYKKFTDNCFAEIGTSLMQSELGVLLPNNTYWYDYTLREKNKNTL